MRMRVGFKLAVLLFDRRHSGARDDANFCQHLPSAAVHHSLSLSTGPPHIVHSRQDNSKNHRDDFFRRIPAEGSFETTCYPTGESLSARLAQSQDTREVPTPDS